MADHSPQINPFELASALSAKTCIIDGELRGSVTGETFDVINPATREVIAQAAAGGAADVDAAVASAKRAQRDWRNVSAPERGKLVAAAAAMLADHVEELGRLTALETGKALRTESRVEASVLANVFTFFGGLGSEIKGETVPFRTDMLTMTLREPVGVVGAIIPWNAPLLLMALKVAPALVAGNAVVVKSAEDAPLGVLRVAQLFQRVLPPGVFNLISGFGPAAGAPLVDHAEVAKVTFTGSVETGRIVSRAAADRLVPATLELGGKSPMIVFADADIDKAVAGAITGMRFTRQGQSCTAASRIFVHDDIYETFVSALTARVNELKMGDPLDEATDIGTIISPKQFETVQRYIGMGKGYDGATAHECSQMPSDPKLADGLYVRPVIFTGVSHDSQLAREEVFGPVTCVFRWSDYEEVLAQANDSPFGLAATVWTNDLKRALDAIHRLEAGFVQVNQNVVVQPGLSYGGVKTSGVGKEASLESMLEHFTHKKTVILNMGQ